MPYLWERLLGNTDGKGSNGGGASTSLRLHNVCIERGQIKYVCFWRRGGISVERLTRRLEYGRACFNSNLYGRINKEVCERLAAIEDILSDDYDLDRLKELVQADREGRCEVIPREEFFLRLNSNIYVINDGEVLEVLLYIIGRDQNGIGFIDVVYLPGYENEKRLRFRFSDVGKTVFLAREEAEAALEKMKRGNE